jgi:tRNA modification GTPase
VNIRTDAVVGQTRETIVAIATPPGVGGVGIVRLSGPLAPTIAKQSVQSELAPRRAQYHPFRDLKGVVIDAGIVLFFPGPASYTGEDVVEFHAHGSPVLLQALVDSFRAAGARMARPGEFTERAFLNGKLDLAQAEAVADLIHAQTLTAARLARNSLDGGLAREIDPLMERIQDMRMSIEADIDFGETDLDSPLAAIVAHRALELAAEIARRLRELRPMRAFTHGLRVALAGAPNVGKSSLMNALAAREVAIVTDVPGTTRDLLRAPVAIHGIPLELIDTAGLRSSDDPVERIGIERAREVLASVDLILEIRDLARPEAIVPLLDAERIPRIVVWNKGDLVSKSIPAAECTQEMEELVISVRTGEGLDQLCDRIRDQLGIADPGPDGFSVRARHLDALEQVQRHLVRIEPHQTPDLIAENLRLAAAALDELLGRGDHEALLGRIFSGFCIGK